MRKVMLVDDEVLALDYLKNILDWEAHGYQIVGTAVNGRKAMELYGKTTPEIVISDIKMAGMDGLELARRLKEKDPDVIVIFLSAYRDFEYAQQGIRYGVSNYLLKHELSPETLLEELRKIDRRLDFTSKRKKLYQTYFVNQLLYDRPAGELLDVEGAEEPLMLFLVHKRSCFRSGEFTKADWVPAETRVMEELPQMEAEGLVYVADVPVTPDNWVVLCRLDRVSSVQVSEDRVKQWAETLIARLHDASGAWFNAVCSRHIDIQDVSRVFRQMTGQIQRAFFWNPNTACFLSAVPEEKPALWREALRKLERALYDEAAEPGKSVRELLETLREEQNIKECQALLLSLNGLLQEVAGKTGLELKPSVCASMDEVIRCYEEQLEMLHDYLSSQEKKNYSRVVAEAVAYIRRNYKKELNLEILGAEFHMNGVYLGQIFKKEVGLTVLKYQTALRMDEAKRLLREENCTVAEAARRVGYQTSQYFSQVFARSTGKKPQEYRKRKS